MVSYITSETKDITVITKQVTTVISELNELKKLVQEQLQKQQDYIKNSLNHRDEILTATLRKMKESQLFIPVIIVITLHSPKQFSYIPHIL